MTEPTCKEIVSEHLSSRMADIRKLWKSYQKDTEAYVDDLGNLLEYGLDIGYVAPEENERGYFRWQLSTGGPGDEFRFYAEGKGYTWYLNRIEYVYLDWFDDAKKNVTGKRFKVLEEIFQDWVDCGNVQNWYDMVMEDFSNVQ